MAKKKGFNPFILLGDAPGDDNVIGGGTGQGAMNPFPMGFSAWQTSGFQEDYDLDQNGTFDFLEYTYWWKDCKFTYDQWKACGNSDADWETYFSNPEP